MSDQMIFKRYEMKYLLSRTQYLHITEAFDGRMKPDIHGKSTILSLYFDTPDDLLIRRSLEKPLYKEKLRVRSYGIADTDTTVFVELKKKYQSVVYKRRIAMSEEEARRYLLSHASVMDTQISREIDYCLFHYHNLMPRMLLSYDRTAFYAMDNPQFRITFDENILWRDHDVTLTTGIGGTAVLPADTILMEVKTADAIPLWLVQLLSREKIYKTSFSKYGTAWLQKQRRF